MAWTFPYGATYSFPVFLILLAAEWSGQRGATAGAFALHNLVVGLAATVVDSLMARVGQRLVLTLGGLVLGAGLAISGRAASPLELLVWFGILAGIGAGALGSVAQTIMLSRWFPAARGTVTGLALSGMGIGSGRWRSCWSERTDRGGSCTPTSCCSG